PIDDPLRLDFDSYLPNDLLLKTDTASMAVGLEVRAPFLARELVDAALRARDPSHGVRDLDAVAALAADAGMGPPAITRMPANNLLVAFTKD
ncbi:MAG: asparagine synthase-related protein, partial [Pseudomonadota bacterium]